MFLTNRQVWLEDGGMSRHLPGLGALRTFEAAARHQGFTKAAAELGVTPAAVSSQIRALEDQLGVRLFFRTSRTVRPTEAGTVLLAAGGGGPGIRGRGGGGDRGAGGEGIGGAGAAPLPPQGGGAR